jgi:16S rRNA (uracil1498-N3)-methyltransferase
MRLTRVYVEAALSTGALIVLAPGASQHLVRVLRLAVGAPLTLFNGQGGEYEARVESILRGAVTVQVGAFQAIERESPLGVTLLQGIARGEKMDLILQKATELGVTRIVPLRTAHSNVRLTDETARRKHEHWRGVVASACEQSGRNRVPEVLAPTALAEAVQAAREDLRLLLSPAPEAESLAVLLTRHSVGGRPPSICLLIGPEGGFDADEVRSAMLAGFVGCRLGPRVLRTETAALAALAALQFAAGDFGQA